MITLVNILMYILSLAIALVCFAVSLAILWFASISICNYFNLFQKYKGRLLPFGIALPLCLVGFAAFITVYSYISQAVAYVLRFAG